MFIGPFICLTCTEGGDVEPDVLTDTELMDHTSLSISTGTITRPINITTTIFLEYLTSTFVGLVTEKVDGLGTTLGHNEDVFCDVRVPKGVHPRGESRGMFVIDELIMEVETVILEV